MKDESIWETLGGALVIVLTFLLSFSYTGQKILLNLTEMLVG